MGDYYLETSQDLKKSRHQILFFGYLEEENPRPVFRHENGFFYLFHNEKYGWQIGFDKSGSRTLLKSDSDSVCPQFAKCWEYRRKAIYNARWLQLECVK